MIDLKITRHAIKRAKERFGMNYKELQIKASLSLTDGIDAMADPTLREMCINKFDLYDISGIYLYQNVVYIFIDDRLITVYPISWIGRYHHSES